MNGVKIIKTTFGEKKDIICVKFDGVNNYELFVDEVRKTYDLSADTELNVLSQDHIIKPNIFTDLVAQYIGSSDFVLDIKISNADSSILNLTSSESGVDVTSGSSGVHQFLATTDSTNVLRTVSFSQDNIFITEPDDWSSLPSIEEIRKIPDILRFVNSKTLENKDRVKISKALIAFILNKNLNRQLIKDDFVQLSQSILDIFPSEVKETYYIPFRKGHLSKGKLYDAYNNLRSKLSSAGLIKRRIKTVSEKQTNHNSKTEYAENTVDAKELKVITTNGFEWDKVLEVWEKSHFLRQKELQNNDLATFDYLQKYKVLLNEKSYELFEIDFKILFPSSNNIDYWKLYYLKVIAKAEKLKDNRTQEILSYIEKTDDEDSKLALALMLVAYILPNTRKNTKLEIQESFIYYCKNILQADDETRHRLKRLKTEYQPKIYFVGDSIKSIAVAYVDISGTRLKFENPLKAVEVCFHCFMAMNIKFPKDCAHVWTFLQKITFEISTPWDDVIPSVSTLINDLHSDT